MYRIDKSRETSIFWDWTPGTEDCKLKIMCNDFHRELYNCSTVWLWQTELQIYKNTNCLYWWWGNCKVYDIYCNKCASAKVKWVLWGCLLIESLILFLIVNIFSGSLHLQKEWYQSHKVIYRRLSFYDNIARITHKVFFFYSLCLWHYALCFHSFPVSAYLPFALVVFPPPVKFKNNKKKGREGGESHHGSCSVTYWVMQ